MRFIRNIGVALVCCVILVSGQEQTTESGETTPVIVTTSTQEPTTTAKPTTAAPPDTTTSQTTTAVPTTPPAPPAPPAPTPTPVPTPDYPRNSGKWTVEDSTNATCIILKAATQIVVVNENQTTTINIPPKATSTGSCADPQQITLTWPSAVADKQNTLILSFESRNTTKGAVSADNGITNGKFGLQNVTATLYLNATNATDTPVQRQLVNLATFQTPFKHSYYCLAEEILKSESGDFSLKLREVQLEAYRQTPAGHREFSTPSSCLADDTTDVVPIAVGAALAGLVVIVLIAYLIGRRRSRARGYQSV